MSATTEQLAGWPINWVEVQGRRVDSIVAKGFEKAAERACPYTGNSADARRREIARMQDAPRFPAEWGDYLAKYWIVTGRRGEQCVSPIPPVDGKGLTVWRFADCEITATFDLWRVYGTRAGGNAYGEWGIEFYKNPPPVGKWQEAGPTDNFSTLWRRPLKGGAA